MNLAVIVEKRALTDGVFSLTFADGAIAENAAPGQFVHIRCGHSRILRRPFGVCDVNGERVTVVFAARGGGTDWLAGREPGQTLDVLGALGHGFTFAANSRVVLVGGGVGAAPLLYAAKRARAAAVLGFKSERDMILRAEFEKSCDKIYLTTDDGSFGVKGTAARPLAELLQAEKFDAVLSCGPRPMLKAVADVCAENGVPCQVSLEERMGCGVGACLVCACKTVENGEERMRRVCKDGPVFDAREVAWE